MFIPGDFVVVVQPPGDGVPQLAGNSYMSGLTLVVSIKEVGYGTRGPKWDLIMLGDFGLKRISKIDAPELAKRFKRVETK